MLSVFNFNQLYYFWIIAKEGSLKEASLSLHVTQPTLTYQVKSLESFFGVKLFERKGRRMVLNEKGKIVFEYCNKIFPVCNELIEMIKFKRDKARETIRIGIIPSISKDLILKVIKDLLKDKKLKLSIVENEFKNMISFLDSGELDIIFSDYKMSNISKSVECMNYVERKFIFVCNAKFKFKNRGFIKQMEELRFINYTSESIMHSRILHYFHKRSISTDIVAEIDDIAILKKMASVENYCAVVPALAAGERIERNILKKLAVFPDTTQSIFVYIHDKNDKPIIKKIIKNLMP